MKLCETLVSRHCPVNKMQCRSKISCLSWNPYFKKQIASSDYEGVVSTWDAYRGERIAMFEEHEKRAWSVDFSPSKPTTLASGSDDAKVKIWDVDMQHSVATITSKANVCCVKFNPESSNHIAFGSAGAFRCVPANICIPRCTCACQDNVRGAAAAAPSCCSSKPAGVLNRRVVVCGRT